MEREQLFIAVKFLQNRCSVDDAKDGVPIDGIHGDLLWDAEGEKKRTLALTGILDGYTKPHECRGTAHERIIVVGIFHTVFQA